jgi:hypothetical protein
MLIGAPSGFLIAVSVADVQIQEPYDEVVSAQKAET